MNKDDEELSRRDDRADCARHRQRISLSDGCPICADYWEAQERELLNLDADRAKPITSVTDERVKGR